MNKLLLLSISLALTSSAFAAKQMECSLKNVFSINQDQQVIAESVSEEKIVLKSSKDSVEREFHLPKAEEFLMKKNNLGLSEEQSEIVLKFVLDNVINDRPAQIILQAPYGSFLLKNGDWNKGIPGGYGLITASLSTMMGFGGSSQKSGSGVSSERAESLVMLNQFFIPGDETYKYLQPTLTNEIKFDCLRK